jgi:hypothetical protein
MALIGGAFNFTLLYPTARPKPGPISETYSKDSKDK